MPQAKLPDINAGFVKYRTQARIDFSMKQYSLAAGALNNMNAFLPETYKVEMNTEKYNELIKTHVIAICNHCSAETNRNELSVMKILTTPLIGLITNSEYELIWACDKCKHDNFLLKTEMKATSLAKPYYLKVVPESPRLNDKLQTRTKFHQQFEAWFNNYLEELEYQLGLYRAEYASQLDYPLDIKDEDIDNNAT